MPGVGGVPQGIPDNQGGTTHSADGPIGHTNNAENIRVPPPQTLLTSLTIIPWTLVGHLCPCQC